MSPLRLARTLQLNSLTIPSALDTLQPGGGFSLLLQVLSDPDPGSANAMNRVSVPPVWPAQSRQRGGGS